MRRNLRADNLAYVPDTILERLPESGFLKAVNPTRLVELVRNPAELLRRGWRLAEGSQPVTWYLGGRAAGQRILLLKSTHQVVLESQGGAFIHRIRICLRRGQVLESGFAVA